MKLGKALITRFGFGAPQQAEDDAFDRCLMRLKRAQPKQTSFRQLFKNRPSRLAA